MSGYEDAHEPSEGVRPPPGGGWFLVATHYHTDELVVVWARHLDDHEPEATDA